jgi:hypothetical protein
MNATHPVLNGNDPATAGARCIIKRTLVLMDVPFEDNPELLSGYFIAHPWACTKAIEGQIKRAIQTWEDGNNSGNPRELDRCNAKSELQYSHVERLMSLIGVTLDYPGLYPCYNFNGRTHHTLADLWRTIREHRAAQD